MSPELTVTEFLWALSLSSVSFYGPYSNQKINLEYEQLKTIQSIDNIPSEIIHGANESSPKKIKKRMECFLKYRLGLMSSAQYSLVFKALIDPDNKVMLQVNHSMLEVLRYNMDDIKEMKKNNEEDSEYYKALYIYKDCWTNDSFLAYNYANAIQLARLSAFNGYISNEQAINDITTVAMMIKGKYQSYYDFGLKASIAFHIDKSRLKSSKYSHRIVEDKHRFSHVMYGSWSNMIWQGNN